MISTEGICFKGLSSSVIISSVINLQKTGYEFEHIGWIPDIERMTEKNVS